MLVNIYIRSPIVEAAKRMARDSGTSLQAWLSDMMDTYVVSRYEAQYHKRVGDDFPPNPRESQTYRDHTE